MVLGNGASPFVGWASVSRADFSIVLASSFWSLALSLLHDLGEEGGGKRDDCLGIFPAAGVFVGRLHSEPPTCLPLNFPENISLCLLVFHSVGV